jgi:fibro-slime domain-containing protein
VVAIELDSDEKPVLERQTWSIDSPDSFAQWYRDVSGINQAVPVELQLEYSSTDEALFEYRSHAFFPIDGLGLGNDGRRHNYHFTLEARTEFRYVGGEVFTFIGDDDLWVFVNGLLAIDLGGLHESEVGSVRIDEHANVAGMQVGEVYPLHVFFAERHTIESNFTIVTSIAGPPQCD